MSKSEALELLKTGKPKEAAALIETWLRDHDSDAGSWFLLGACRHAGNELVAAADAFNRCLQCEPTHIEAHLARLTVLRAAGDVRGALVAGQKALKLLSNQPRLRYATALCLEELGRDDEALAQYDLALRAAPDFADAYHNRGLLLAKMGRLGEAEENQRRYLEAAPRSTRAISGLVDILIAQQHLEEAMRALSTLQTRASDASVLVRRGVILACQRDFSQSRIALDEARERDARGVLQYLQRLAPGADPDAMLSPRNIYLGHCWRALGQCDWKDWDAFVGEFRQVAADPGIVIEPAVAFMSRLLPLSGIERLAVCRQVARRIEASNPPYPQVGIHHRPRIRIGVLSPDFREHLNAYALRPFFELLDRARFEVYAYSLSQDDDSAIRAQIRSAADRFRDLNDLTDTDAAAVIRRDDADILVDAGGYTTGARFGITARRPARLQVNYLGFSCSLGSQRVDYAIVDRIVGGDKAEWAEARVLLPDTHFLYDFRGPDPDAPVVRRDYGLPEHAMVYCAFHQAEKIAPDIFGSWMDILAQVPDSVLWLRALSEHAARNLRAYTAQHGIDPDRLVFAPFEASQDPRYLARHRLGDLMLDSPHHNAMTTACDALRMGLPLLTVPGDAMAARASESLLRATGMPQLVVANREEYVRSAVSFGKDAAALRDLRDQLIRNRATAPLFDTAARVRALEAAFLKMCERLARGEPPDTLEV